jgi:hypothetical protein
MYINVDAPPPPATMVSKCFAHAFAHAFASNRQELILEVHNQLGCQDKILLILL